MEKTILYSKKSPSIAPNLDIYEHCEHQHCKNLLLHIKFLSNSLTQKVLKEQCKSHENILKPKELNIPANCQPKSDFTKALQEQIQHIKKNYTKLRKQLSQIETENDELFEENQILKKKLQKLTDQFSKASFELSMTRSPVDTKNSFYQPSTTHRNSCDLDPKQVQNIDHKTHDADFSSINAILPGDLTKDTLQKHHRTDSTEKGEIYERYEKLIKQIASMQHKINEKDQSIRQNQQQRKKLEFENSQLKKIIKLRNQIQVERHKTINGLKNVIDQMIT